MLRKARRAPLWVQQLQSRDLHGLAGKLHREWRAGTITPAQSWLLDHCLNDLEYRWYSAYPVWHRCSCWMCVPPFELLSDGCGVAGSQIEPWEPSQ